MTPSPSPSQSPEPPLPSPVASLSYLSVASCGGGITQWIYTPPAGHLSTHLADPAYWSHIASDIRSGDWLFTTHTAPSTSTSQPRRYNILYAMTDGPLGIWAQQLLSSIPSITSLER